MKYKYNIITDATANLPAKFYEEGFSIIPMDYVIDGKSYSTADGLSPHEFFEKMRDGATPTTSLINTQTAVDFFTPVLEKGQDIFFVCFSSALSGSYKSISIAKEELSSKYPDRKIYVLDSRCASGGEGFLVYYCLKKRREGMSFDELISFAEKFKNHCHHDFTVDNLMNLYRGGRLGITAAIVGTAIKVKPMLIVDTEGRLIPITKVVGRKASLKALVDKMVEKSAGYDNSELVIIEHADCEEDAIAVKNKIAEKFGYANIIINSVDPVIGSHLGPDAITLFYNGADKEK